jgi:hypothetical protein
MFEECMVYLFVIINVLCLVFYSIDIVKINLDEKVNMKLFALDFLCAFSSFYYLSSNGYNDVFALIFALWCLLILGIMSFLNF